MRRYLNPLTIFLFLALSACSANGAVGPEEFPSLDDQDETVQSKVGLSKLLPKLDIFVSQTSQGRNLSEMSLGVYISNLLGQLSSLDVPLSTHIHQGGRFIDSYLSEVFQFKPDKEIAEILHLSGDGNVQARKTAAAALECLRHIPNAKSTSADQEQDRKDLTKALLDLKLALNALVSSLP
jgi:hypothetical protein